MDLKLFTNPDPEMDKRLFRMRADAVACKLMTISELRACYGRLERVRDTISGLLDKVDSK